MTSRRRRLDILLVEQGYFPSRERAREAILAGQILVNGQRATKPGRMVGPEDRVEVLKGTEEPPYVSRGGEKLAHALRFFGIDLKDLVVIDVGASTGGFTDCALRAGARKVFAVDVGYGQLDWRLRQDPRVVVLERTNIRYLSPATLGELADFATVDVSFISLTKVLPAVGRLLKPEGRGLALIKPQFEAGPEKVGKKGVVRDPAVHAEVCHKVLDFLREQGWEVRGLTFSPLRGGEGNIEFFVYFSLVPGRPWRGTVEEVVTEAHAYFAEKGRKPE
ncbi:TlyA family RNA methyltransferase [Ammonifex thiophilus]|uniref:TlyA family RNA methyltransferase n=1 Tax=Ammonifex thiophilus TaxID=444093 RepID=A0A3D8P4D5_9THEO|nr:TlyA family RNA methyltransferase [Ammonifex thiophilus]RDV83995.1 TlyA family RNA methyltransferase [Ammonifex thiophilus]